jgi:hypothetical protein
MQTNDLLVCHLYVCSLGFIPQSFVLFARYMDVNPSAILFDEIHDDNVYEVAQASPEKT